MDIIGIDYGNYSTYVSKIENNNTKIILSPSSNRYFKNLISFKEKTYFDTEAENFYISNYQNNIFNHKIIMNICNYGNQTNINQYNTKKLNENLFNNKLNKGNIEIGNGEKYNIEQIMALNINNLINTDKKSNIFFSIPDYYSIFQRQKIIDTFKIIDYENIKLVNETDIISTKYGFYSYINNHNNKKVLFIDFGDTHISCFITIFQDNKYVIENYKYDINIGGLFIDLIITNYIEEQINKDLNVKKLDYKYKLKIMKESKKIKKNLNLNQDVFFKKECFYNHQDVNIQIKKETFKELIKNTENDIELFFDNYINVNNIDLSQIDCVEILGGSSRLNFFRDIIKNKFSTKISTTLNIDETISEGLNIFSAIRLPRIITKEYIVKQYNNESIYIINGDEKIKLFNIKDSLPNNKEINIEVKDINKIFIANDYDKKNIILNNYNPEGSTKIEISFKLDNNQIISIEKIMQGDKVIDFEFITNLSNSELETLKIQNNKILKKNKDIDILYESINKLEKLYYDFYETVEQEYYRKLYTNKEIDNNKNIMEKIYQDIENSESNESIILIQQHIDFINKQNEDILVREKKIKNINLKLNKLKSIIDNSNKKNFNYIDFIQNNDFQNIEKYENNIKILDEEINNLDNKTLVN
jgi:molecular chaperone DnaK (HSP70)